MKEHAVDVYKRQQLTQYVEKNVQDAMDWMDTTEGAMKKVSSTFTDMEGYFSQGANSYPESKERTAILTQLRPVSYTHLPYCKNGCHLI